MKVYVLIKKREDTVHETVYLERTEGQSTKQKQKKKKNASNTVFISITKTLSWYIL